MANVPKEFAEVCMYVPEKFRTTLYLRYGDKVYDYLGNVSTHERYSEDHSTDGPHISDYKIPQYYWTRTMTDAEAKLYAEFKAMIVARFKRLTAIADEEHCKQTFFIWCTDNCPKTVMREVCDHLRTVFTGISYKFVMCNQLICIINYKGTIRLREPGMEKDVVISDSEEDVSTSEESEEETAIGRES